MDQSCVEEGMGGGGGGGGEGKEMFTNKGADGGWCSLGHVSVELCVSKAVCGVLSVAEFETNVCV